MLKLGFVAGAAGYHAVQFAKMFNGMNEAHKDLDPFGGGPPMATIEGAKVVRVYDEYRSGAELLSKLCDVPQVADSLEEMFEGLDAIVICDDLKFTHYRFARPFLQRGIPVLLDKLLLDKPFPDNVERARDLIDCARDHESLLMTSSALKYARAFEKLYRGEESIGEVVMACCMGPADLMWKRPFVFYGMHAVTIGHYAINDRPVEVVDIGERGRSVVGVKYMNGAQLTTMCPHGVPVGFQALVQGTQGAFHARDDDAGYFYSTMLKDFLAMVEKGAQTFDLLQALEVYQICCAQEESVRTGKPVRLG